MPKAKVSAPTRTVVRRYQAAGECRELGIHCIPLGYIEVEELSDGSFRMADAAADGGIGNASEDAPADETDETEAPAEPTPDAVPDAVPDEPAAPPDPANDPEPAPPDAA